MSTAAGIEAFEIFAELSGTELLVIDETTTRRAFGERLRWDAAYYRLAQGL
jgi:L-arabinose isomerase